MNANSNHIPYLPTLLVKTHAREPYDLHPSKSRVPCRTVARQVLIRSR